MMELYLKFKILEAKFALSMMIIGIIICGGYILLDVIKGKIRARKINKEWKKHEKHN